MTKQQYIKTTFGRGGARVLMIACVLSGFQDGGAAPQGPNGRRGSTPSASPQRPDFHVNQGSLHPNPNLGGAHPGNARGPQVHNNPQGLGGGPQVHNNRPALDNMNHHGGQRQPGGNEQWSHDHWHGDHEWNGGYAGHGVYTGWYYDGGSWLIPLGAGIVAGAALSDAANADSSQQTQPNEQHLGCDPRVAMCPSPAGDGGYYGPPGQYDQARGVYIPTYYAPTSPPTGPLN